MKNYLIRTIISILALLAMLAHLVNWREVQFGWESLTLLAIAVLPWLSEFIDTFKLGKDSFEIKLREVEKKADAAMDASLRGVAKDPSAQNLTPAADSVLKATKGLVNDDPQKGLWGGSPAVNGRQLSARIEKIPGENYFRRLVLRVTSTDPSKPVTGIVTFHLHPTFNTPDLDVPSVNGVAETSLVSYGVFTIGAEVDGGTTKLELDLASLDDGRDQFFKR